MIKELSKFINFFEVGDLKFVILILKKNIKNLLLLSLLVASLALVISLNVEKKIYE